MPLKLTCPKCGSPNRVGEPYPMPGDTVQCTNCAAPMLVSYPKGVIDKLRERGKTFAGDASKPPTPVRRAPTPAPPPPSGLRSKQASDVPKPRVARPPKPTAPPAPTPVDTREVAPTSVDRQPPAAQSTAPDVHDTPSYTAAPTRADDQPLKAHPTTPGESFDADAELRRFQQDSSSEEEQTEVFDRTTPAPAPAVMLPPPAAAQPTAPPNTQDRPPKPPKKKKGKWLVRLAMAAVVLVVGGLALGGAAIGGVYWYYGQQLPSVDALSEYRPNTVTEVYDFRGNLMGELYEERRYVTELSDIPDVVQNAFISAEDAGFREHGGVDYVGLFRAVLNELAGGEKRQGASTITMQVTRNFLLTRDKTYERKIKEIILAQRIEHVYDKERILWLYLNELYLGSGAYGVEAASRVYFGKHVSELTIGEAALIAGLAPAPSKYSPHKSWKKARTRQLYVLDQMHQNKYITDAELEAAKAEDIRIVKEDNPFLTLAPHFTEHVRRYILDKYGFDRVYKEGLRVTTTMDLPVQSAAQAAVTKQVNRVDQRMGFRRAGVVTLPNDAAIAAKREEHEEAMRAQNAFEADPAGRVDAPETSELVEGRVYDAVILEVSKRWARVGIGAHEAIIPLAWSLWVYEPNPRMSWNYRTANDLTVQVRGWEEGVEKGGSLLRKGDVVLVKVEHLTTSDPEIGKRVFKNTPATTKSFVAARLWQAPEVEAATMSFDLKTGAVRSMVGGADFEKSEFNRTTQAKRQVGSTFKPIVYGAAIDTERLTAASIVPDVRGASYTTDAGFVWKPDNYGDDYLGNITLRRALALSKNTCTIKVLESMDPGMNDDVLYTFARKLGVGGPPSHTLPEDHVTKPDNDHLCPWVRETRDSTICMDRDPPKDPDISNTKHRRQMSPDDVYMCRACDMSMGLGSASLTMAELLRAYSAFPTGGKLIEPHYILKVEDRDGNVLEEHTPAEFPQVIRPEVAFITTWLLQNVVNAGTGNAARRELGMRFGGKTGTTQDFKDAWFVGFSNDVITAAWVGYDEPRSMGVSSTGGKTALPIWIDVMREAAPKSTDRPFPTRGSIEWALIDDSQGRRVTSGGMSYPFIKGTVPKSSGVAAGEISIDDITDL